MTEGESLYWEEQFMGNRDKRSREKAAAKNRTKEERAEQARKAAQARWSKAQKIDSPG
jgi:hypothetical protein